MGKARNRRHMWRNNDYRTYRAYSKHLRLAEAKMHHFMHACRKRKGQQQRAHCDEIDML